MYVNYRAYFEEHRYRLGNVFDLKVVPKIFLIDINKTTRQFSTSEIYLINYKPMRGIRASDFLGVAGD